MPPITHDELEARLELGERAAAHGIRTVALQQAVEPEPPGRGADRQRERGEHEARPSPATNAPSSAKTAGSTSDDATITSSRTERRSTGADDHADEVADARSPTSTTRARRGRP